MKRFSSTLLVLFFLSGIAMAQLPKLSSYPSAAAVVFLDFDGHYLDGTSWNGNGPFECNGANLASDQITEIFNRVAEDYRPFNVNVTTDSTRYWAAPATQRMRVILTTSSSWYGSAGGVSFTNSFAWGDNTPCFVFTALLNYNTKYIAEAASHETGHTMGLNHQSAYDAVCNKTSEYNSGVGSGEIGWAPIMGVGYYRNQTLWHYGSNPYGCSYMQDDLGIITGASNGIGYRRDDFGATASGAAAVAFTNNQFSVNGVVEKPNDIDMIKFTVPTRGQFILNANPFSTGAGANGANLDLQVELLNNAQSVVGSYNPATALNASIDTMLNAGTYYLRVQGSGNAYAPNFASLGSYTLNAALASGVLPLRKLELRAGSENGRHKLNWDIVADEKVVSQTLEVAADGTQYQTLSALDATERSFAYQPGKANTAYYRLSVAFDNGRQYYSNVAVIPGDGAARKPYLVSNTVSSTLTVNSQSVFAYTIVDFNGRILARGQVAAGSNSLPLNNLSNGLYLLTMTAGGEQYTEKFMKK